MNPVTYRTADVDGFDVFYREAGDAAKPTLLLLCRVLDFNATPQKTPALRAARFRRSMAAVFAGCGGNSGTLSG